MKPKEIWGYTDPKTGKQTGWKVLLVSNLEPLALVSNVKDPWPFPGACVYLNEKGFPIDRDGVESADWKLIEKAP